MRVCVATSGRIEREITAVCTSKESVAVPTVSRRTVVEAHYLSERINAGCDCRIALWVFEEDKARPGFPEE